MNKELEGKLPSGVALSWGLVKPQKRGPKREMSLKQIVDTAVAIADEEGLSAVTMNRVASLLGFTTMSLYRYVPSKDDLMLLMQDAVCNITLAAEKSSKDWRGNLHNFVRTIIHCYLDHPWLCDIPASGIPITPNNLRIVDWALRLMSELPLNHQEKLFIVGLLTNHARVYGMLYRDIKQAMHTGVNSGPIPGVDYNEALKQLVTSERFPHLHPVVLAGAYSLEGDKNEGSPYPYEYGFDFGIERILDGLDQYITSKIQKRSDKI